MRVLTDDATEENFTDARLGDARRLMGVRLAAGEPLAGRFPEAVRVLIESDGEPNDYFVAGPMPVVSDRVKRVFDSFRANVEYHPLVVMLHDGQLAASRYYFPNFLDLIDCLDWDAAGFTREGDFATNVRTVVLREPPARGVPVFRVARTTASLVCVQDDVAHALEEARCKGVVLLPPSEWRNPAYPA